MLHYAEKHLKEIARKSIEADMKLATLFQEIAGISEQQAFDLVNWYKRKRLVNLDLTNTSLRVKHGAYLEVEFIQHYATHGAE